MISRCVVLSEFNNAHVAVSPRGDLAAVLWRHQTEGGVKLVALEEGTARVKGQGYTTNETNNVEGPTFSPDGRFVAISEGFTWWWLPEWGEETSEDEPSPGGTFRRGRLTLINVDTGFLQERDVFGEVEKGWVPPHETWEEFQLLGKPQFTSEREVVLTPQFGKPHAFAVPH